MHKLLMFCVIYRYSYAELLQKMMGIISFLYRLSTPCYDVRCAVCWAGNMVGVWGDFQFSTTRLCTQIYGKTMDCHGSRSNSMNDAGWTLLVKPPNPLLCNQLAKSIDRITGRRSAGQMTFTLV